MKKNLLGIAYVLIFACGLQAQVTQINTQKPDIVIPSSQVKLLKTFRINSARMEAPVEVDSVAHYALYSNVTTFSGSGFNNGGAAVQSGNTITTLVADSLGLIGTPPFSVASFTFSVVNFNGVAVSARTHIRFYAADGPAGSPGTLIAGFTYPASSFTAASIALFTISVTPFTVTTQAIWAGLTFDNDTATTGATLAQLNNLGQAFFDPIDRGSSTDNVFVTDMAGSFLADNPAGGTGNVGGDPLANLGWEIVSVPIPLGSSDWRWRNDDGSETTATWMAPENTQVTITSNSEILRLRLFFDNFSGSSVGVFDTLQYATSFLGPWTNLDVTTGSNPFQIAGTSAFVTQAEPTTQQLSTSAAGGFASGKIMVDSMILKNFSLANTFGTEFEWTIRCNTNIKPNTTYYFREWGSLANDPDIGLPASLVTLSLADIDTWIGGTDSVWEKASNWSTGVIPGASSEVFINSGNVILKSNATVLTLSVGPGAIFTVATGFKLKVVK